MIYYIKRLILFIFNCVDLYYHQKRIAFYLKRKKNKIDIFFDVGSHLGAYTDMVVKAYPNCKSFLFEPQSKIFKKIEQKYLNNKNINVFNLAISDTEKKQNLNLNNHDLTASLLDYDPKSNYLKFKAKLYQSDISNMNYGTELVQVITLDKFIIDNNLEIIDLLKIDTEGNELNVLKGLKKKINIVNYILIEIHHRKLFLNYDPNIIHQYLIDNGFKLEKKFKFPFCWVDCLYSKK
jgi:FkbM family methyltransferase